MIPYQDDRECCATQGSGVAGGLTKRRIVDYCRVTAAL
jgi:hypothetical protein